jgi:nucleoside 2-deoxyribosyltransferase
MTTRIYLAGGFYKGYKTEIRARLGAGFELHDPEDGVVIPGRYVGEDLDAIEDCDLVLAYHDEYPFVYGMAAEIGYAVAVGKPVIYVCTRPRIDSFLAGLSRATFTNLGPACAFVGERYA